MYAHTCARDMSAPMCVSSSPISLSVHKLKVSEGLQHLSSGTAQCAQSKPQVLWCFFCWLLGLWGLNLRAKRSKQKNRLNGSKWQSQSNREQEIIRSTSLPGRFMREGEQIFPWRKDKEADYDILYFIVLPEMELRALFSALIYCVKH